MRRHPEYVACSLFEFMQLGNDDLRHLAGLLFGHVADGRFNDVGLQHIGFDRGRSLFPTWGERGHLETTRRKLLWREWQRRRTGFVVLGQEHGDILRYEMRLRPGQDRDERHLSYPVCNDIPQRRPGCAVSEVSGRGFAEKKRSSSSTPDDVRGCDFLEQCIALCALEITASPWNRRDRTRCPVVVWHCLAIVLAYVCTVYYKYL